MMNRELTEELYRSAVHRIHAPEELARRIAATEPDAQPVRRRRAARVALRAAAAAAALVVLSNVAAYAATGQPWIGRVFNWDDEPARPMENIADFFKENRALFDSDTPQRDYYGGTYLDGGTQVILLTDLSRRSEWVSPGENVRFEKCAYTLAELNRTIDEINARADELRDRGEPFAGDFVGMALDEKENCIRISILSMADEKVAWFRENICDAAYLVFENTDTLPALD